MKTFFFHWLQLISCIAEKCNHDIKKLYIYGANLIIIYSKAEEFESKYVLY